MRAYEITTWKTVHYTVLKHIQPIEYNAKNNNQHLNEKRNIYINTKIICKRQIN